MTKQTGLGDNAYVGGYDLSGDVLSLGRIGGGPAALDVTAINKSGYERIGGVREGAIEFTTAFNKATGQEHLILNDLPTTDVLVSYCRGVAIGSPVASCLAKQVNYDGSRAADGMYTFAVQALSNGYGVEWGNLLTAGLRTDTSATSPATGLDLTTVETLFGWQAYLQVVAFTGTSVTVTLQDSADNSSFANLTGGAFTAATAIGSQRLEGGRTATVRRYVRAITTGTFSNAVFAVAFVRNDTTVSF